MALEPAGLDQARGVLAGRVAEHRAGIRKFEWLLGDALREQFPDAGSGTLLVTYAETEPSCEKPFILAQFRPAQRDAPIAGLEIGGLALAQFPAARHRQHLRDDVPGFRPVAAGIHRERPTHRSGHSGEELRALVAACRREARYLGTGDARFGVHQVALDAHRAVRAVHQDDRPVKSAITHEQIASKSHEADPFAPGKDREECSEVGAVGRNVGASGDAARAPADMLRHRFVQPQGTAQRDARSVDRLSHVHLPVLASAAGTPPIEPAPMVSTTSPGRTTLRMASGMSAILSTNMGSVLPATRIARTSERPSAATIGVSPAG